MNGQVLKALVELTDDKGAETLARYFVQIEYTAHCCIRLLVPAHRLEAVIPETGDDVLLDFDTRCEMHQLKTRDESAGQWLASEVIPISATQLVRSKHLSKPCTCVFVSNAAASPSESKENCHGFARFNFLRKLTKGSTILSPKQASDLAKSQEAWRNVLVDALVAIDASFDVTVPDNLISALRYDTDCSQMRPPNQYTDFFGDNITALGRALTPHLPGSQPLTLRTLEAMYENLLVLIIKRTIFKKNGDERPIKKSCVIDACLQPANPIGSSIDLVTQAGRSLAEKKAHYGGFDPTDLAHISRNSNLGKFTMRELGITHGENKASSLAAALTDYQRAARRTLSKKYPNIREIGPDLLDFVTAGLQLDRANIHPLAAQVEVSDAVGIIWHETDECRAWWHGYEVRALA